MDKPPFVPPIPHIDPPSPETIEKVNSISKRDLKLLKKSDYYRKALEPARKRRKEQKRKKRQEWFWNKGIQILNLFLALIAAVTGIIALLRQ